MIDIEKLKEARRSALEDAATICDDHAAFLRKEAHASGDWDHLISRHEEAICLAAKIRRLKN